MISRLRRLEQDRLQIKMTIQIVMAVKVEYSSVEQSREVIVPFFSSFNVEQFYDTNHLCQRPEHNLYDTVK